MHRDYKYNACIVSALLGAGIASSMASSSFLSLKHRFTLIVVLSIAATCCKSVPVDIIDKALECFHDHYVYSSCEEAYRLHPEGAIHVPPEAVDEYCGGPCLKEAKLVLKCIDGILYNFKFYNGASIRDVSYTLATGCGHTGKRGDFDIAENIGAVGLGDFNHGNGNKVAICTPLLMIILSGVLLLWG